MEVTNFYFKSQTIRNIALQSHNLAHQAFTDELQLTNVHLHDDRIISVMIQMSISKCQNINK